MAHSGAETVLRIGAGVTGFNWLPILLAERLGFLARRGLKLEIHRLGAVDKTTAAVKAGDIDIAVTPPEGAIADRAAGGALRIVAGNANRLPLSLIAQPRYRRIEELKGARLGTSSLTEGTALYTMEVLRRHGLNHPEDYSFSVAGMHPARWEALKAGSIDAAVQLIPLNFVAEDAGYANLGEVSDYIPEIVFAAFIVHDGWAQAHRAALTGFLEAMLEGAAGLQDPANDEALVSIVGEVAQTSGPYAQRSLDYMRRMQVFPPDLSIPEGAFAASLELMRRAGLADEATLEAAPTVLDDSYRLQALRTLRG